MSEQPTPAPSPQEAPPAEAPKPTPPAQSSPDPAREETDWKTEARKWEQRAKENRAMLDPLKEQMDALRKAFGGDQPSEGEDVVKSLQQQMAQMQRDNLVNTVARRHGLTDEADVAFLRTAPDEDAMSALAARLKTPATPPPPATPQPDPGQGDRPPAQAQEDAEYAAFFPDSSK